MTAPVAIRSGRPEDAPVRTSPDLMGIRLYVDKRNTAAQRVYARLGMSREHYEPFEWMKR